MSRARNDGLSLPEGERGAGEREMNKVTSDE